MDDAPLAFTDEALNTFLRRVIRGYYKTLQSGKAASPPEPTPDVLRLLRSICRMYYEEFQHRCDWHQAEVDAAAFVSRLIHEISQIEQQAEQKHRDKTTSIVYRLRKATKSLLAPPPKITKLYVKPNAKQKATVGARIKQN